MPSLSFNYTTAVGPLIQVAIEVAAFNAAQPAAGAPINLHTYMALIDTGASCTCISPKVVNDLGLKSIGKQKVGGVHGGKQTRKFQFSAVLIFPQSQLATGAMNAQLTTYQITGIEFVPPGAFDVLLGRDIICQGVFQMSFDGHAILSL